MGPLPETDEKIIAVIGYLAFFFVVPFIVKPKSKFCMLHAKQSAIMFFLTIIVLMVLVGIQWLGSILTLALFALYIIALYRSAVGDYWKIPVIGNIAEGIHPEALYIKAGISAESLQALKDKATQAAGQVAKSVGKMGSQEDDKKEPQK